MARRSSRQRQTQRLDLGLVLQLLPSVLTAETVGGSARSPPAVARERQHEIERTERRRQPLNPDQIHHRAESRRAGHAADAPHQREGGVGGDQQVDR